MEFDVTVFAPIVCVSVVGIIYLALKLHGETMKFVTEVQFFLHQKTVAYNREKAASSVLKSRMANLERENIRLKKDLKEVRGPIQSEKIEVKSEVPTQDFVERKDDGLEKLERELLSIQKVLQTDLKEQLKGYQREVEWLSKRLGEVQKQIKSSKASSQENNEQTQTSSYNRVA